MDNRINDMSDKDMADILRRYGSQSIEYRRAHRQQYRAMNWRIDYIPDREAEAVLLHAVREGWALSFTDAINQALRAWSESIPE